MVRELRAAVATLLVVGLGAFAHTVAGGAPLQLVPAAVLVVVVGPLVWLLLRSRTSLPRMVVAIAVGQVVTHVTLAAMAPSTGGSATTAHVHGAVALSSEGSAALAGVHLTAPMLVAHLAATLVAGVLLTRGEDVLRAVVRWMLTEAFAAQVPATTARVVVDGGPPVLTDRSVRPVGGRGPPLHSC